MVSRIRPITLRRHGFAPIMPRRWLRNGVVRFSWIDPLVRRAVTAQAERACEADGDVVGAGLVLVRLPQWSWPKGRAAGPLPAADTVAHNATACLPGERSSDKPL